MACLSFRYWKKGLSSSHAAQGQATYIEDNNNNNNKNKNNNNNTEYTGKFTAGCTERDPRKTNCRVMTKMVEMK